MDKCPYSRLSLLSLCLIFLFKCSIDIVLLDVIVLICIFDALKSNLSIARYSFVLNSMFVRWKRLIKDSFLAAMCIQNAKQRWELLFLFFLGQERLSCIYFAKLLPKVIPTNQLFSYLVVQKCNLNPPICILQIHLALISQLENNVQVLTFGAK